MIPDEQAPIELDESLREYLNRMFREARIEDTRKDRLVISTKLPAKPVEGKLYYFENTVGATIDAVGYWGYENGSWVRLSDQYDVRRVRLGQVVANNTSPYATFTSLLSSDYDRYELICDNMQDSGSVAMGFFLDFSADGNPPWQSNGTGFFNTTQQIGDCKIEIMGATDNRVTNAFSIGGHSGNSSTSLVNVGDTVARVHDSVRVRCATLVGQTATNILTGTFTLYGIKND